MGLASGRELQGEGTGSEDSTSLLLIIGYLVVRYLAGDANLLCSSIGGGLGPSCPSTF